MTWGSEHSGHPGAHKGTSMTSTASNFAGCKLLAATVLAFGMLTTASLAHTAEQELSLIHI